MVARIVIEWIPGKEDGKETVIRLPVDVAWWVDEASVRWEDRLALAVQMLSQGGTALVEGLRRAMQHGAERN